MKRAGCIAAVILVLGVVWNWGDLRRYIKIETM
jgi:hypothetical protein